VGEEAVYELARGTIVEVLTLALPVLGVGLVVGLVISIVQTTTSIQEQTLTFVPKLIAMLVVIIFLSKPFIVHLSEFTIRLFRGIAEI